jgi:hypothetical protein
VDAAAPEYPDMADIDHLMIRRISMDQPMYCCKQKLPPPDTQHG